MIIAAVVTIALFAGLTLYLAVKTKQRLPQEMEVVLYFAGSQGEHLIGENRMIRYSKDAAIRSGFLVKELVAGPAQEELMPTIPEGAELIGVSIDAAGVVSLNFTPEFVRNHGGGSSGEMMTVYSIVNSLILNVSKISAVKLLVGGCEAQTLAGHIDLRFPFKANMLLVR